MPGRWIEEERDLPVSLSRLRCANPDTVEWRLSVGEVPVGIVWTGREVTPAEALGRLLRKSSG